MLIKKSLNNWACFEGWAFFECFTNAVARLKDTDSPTLLPQTLYPC